MWLRVGLLLMVLAGRAAAATPADAVRLAHADCKRQPVAVRSSLRFLSLYSIPENQREDFLKALTFSINSLSREAEIIPPRRISADLVSIHLADYDWDAKVWEKFAATDPYFHLKLEKVVEYQDKEAIGYRTPTGAWVTSGTRPVTKREKRVIDAAAPWLPTKEIAELIALTQSQAPILRADWFVVRTAIQVDRKGDGYYDFLRVKNRGDLERLVALDRKAAQRVRREIAAIVAESGVALNNRQIFRFQSITGGYWETRDVNNSLDKRNAMRVLNGDFVHDAEEIYATLPNGLFVMAASDARGNLQDTVPDKIAGDKKATSNDLRIHPMLSCVRCHTEGLRPIDDWARKFYSKDEEGNEIKLNAVEYEKLRRLKQLYLGDLDRWLRRDREDYADTLLKTNGLAPADNARVLSEVWKNYQELPVSGEQLALELGVSADHMRAAFTRYSKRTNLDVVLLGYLKRPEIPARREHIEEIFAVAQSVLRGYIP